MSEFFSDIILKYPHFIFKTIFFFEKYYIFHSSQSLYILYIFISIFYIFSLINNYFIISSPIIVFIIHIYLIFLFQFLFLKNILFFLIAISHNVDLFLHSHFYFLKNILLFNISSDYCVSLCLLIISSNIFISLFNSSKDIALPDLFFKSFFTISTPFNQSIS